MIPAIFSYIGATLTTISFLPQAIKTIKTKDTKDISLLTYSLFVIGTACWTVYGFYLNDLALILANFITTVFASIILTFKIKETIQSKREE